MPPLYKLLVVIPTLGKSDYFSETLESVATLSGSVSCLVVGPSGIKIPKCSLREVEFVAERRGGAGLYGAINEAVFTRGADGWTHLTYINDDDCLGGAFDAVWRVHCRLYSDLFGYGKVDLISVNGDVVSRVPVERTFSRFEALLAQGISPLNQQGMIVPRSLWEKLNGFRQEFRLCADLDFWLRAHRMGWPFRYYPQTVGKFRIREGQLSGDTSRLSAEIRKVVQDGAPRSFSRFELFQARWIFRLSNIDVYAQRLRSRRALRGMQMLAGK